MRHLGWDNEREARIFPLISLWALAQRGRAEIAPATGIIGGDEAETRAVLSRLMRICTADVQGNVPHFAFGFA
jgi:hypothetical protein